jgi:membrane protease YdiL (CAAX protease family)
VSASEFAPKRGLAWVFFGRQGLRAGWGAALFLLLAGVASLVLILGLSALGLHQAQVLGDPNSARGVAAAMGLAALAFAAATGAMALIERRPLSAYGVGRTGLPLGALEGALTGLLAMAVLAGGLVAAGALRIDRVALPPSEAVASGLAWAGAFVLLALAEELSTRGYLLATLTRGLASTGSGARWAAIATTALFAVGHLANPGEGWIGLLSVVMIGLLFCLSVVRTGALWWAIGFHAAWDWAQSFLFGVGDSGSHVTGAWLTSRPDGPAWLSGGATGPEGSVLNLLVILMLTGWVLWRRPSWRQSLRASQSAGG